MPPIARANGNVSFWLDSLQRTTASRPPLPGDLTVDVAIAGAGYTGLWTAYYLKRARPDLEIVVLEREFAGFGASGRNGGWLSDHFSTPASTMEQAHGRDLVLALRRATQDSIDEVIGVCRDEGIDADIIKSGILSVARGPAQDRRLAEHVEAERRWGATESELVELDRPALDQRLRVAGGTSAAWHAHCARIQPAKLARGLAEVVERLGVTIHESTTVSSVEPGLVTTDRGQVRAPVALSCLEGYTTSLPGHKRDLLPLNSAMVVTDPMPERVWAQIGWAGNELFGDLAHAYCYAQRTADGRIAIGGRGVPYRFGSRHDERGASQDVTVRQLVDLLHTYFPAAASVPIAHAWCGVLGVPRDWASFVRYDKEAGTGSAGGYVGNGVTTSNLAARTLRDLVLDLDTELTRLPWVGHRSRRKWEPEPLRWIGARGVYDLYRLADRQEQRRSLTRDSRWAALANLVAGR